MFNFFKPTDNMINKIAGSETTPDEVFRVGTTRYGETTLTLMTSGGVSMTATMNQMACERLIRMLRASYFIEEPLGGEDNA
jgi:hypothetical protein